MSRTRTSPAAFADELSEDEVYAIDKAEFLLVVDEANQDRYGDESLVWRVYATDDDENDTYYWSFTDRDEAWDFAEDCHKRFHIDIEQF